MLGVSVCESAGLQGRRGYPGMHQMGLLQSKAAANCDTVWRGPLLQGARLRAKPVMCSKLPHLTWLCTE